MQAQYLWLRWIQILVDIIHHTIASLMLSKRANNCLERAGIETIDKLLSYTPSELKRLPWLGKVTIKEIVDCLSGVGLSLRYETHQSSLSHLSWTYILLSEAGEIYLGATSNLRSRLKQHNSSGNIGWTKGRRWHILGVRQFETKAGAFAYEFELKKHPHKKIVWKLQCIERATRIAIRHGYHFNPADWLHIHHPSYVKAALRQNKINVTLTSCTVEHSINLPDEKCKEVLTSVSLSEVVYADRGVDVSPSLARFKTDGWFPVGNVDVNCAECGRSPMSGYRKPYLNKCGDKYHYWALLCMNCKQLFEPASLKPDAKNKLKKYAIHLTHDGR